MKNDSGESNVLQLHDKTYSLWFLMGWIKDEKKIPQFKYVSMLTKHDKISEATQKLRFENG